jgi:hypothetical protein
MDVRADQLSLAQGTYRSRTDGRHVAQDLSAINPDPVKGRVRELVDVVPVSASAQL